MVLVPKTVEVLKRSHDEKDGSKLCPGVRDLLLIETEGLQGEVTFMRTIRSGNRYGVDSSYSVASGIVDPVPIPFLFCTQVCYTVLLGFAYSLLSARY